MQLAIYAFCSPNALYVIIIRSRSPVCPSLLSSITSRLFPDSLSELPVPMDHNFQGHTNREHPARSYIPTNHTLPSYSTPTSSFQGAIPDCVSSLSIFAHHRQQSRLQSIVPDIFSLYEAPAVTLIVFATLGTPFAFSAKTIQ